MFRCNRTWNTLVPLHCPDTPLMLHACERESTIAWLMGSGKIGALADITMQAQSILVLIKDLNESQHVVDGVTALLLVLPVM